MGRFPRTFVVALVGQFVNRALATRLADLPGKRTLALGRPVGAGKPTVAEMSKAAFQEMSRGESRQRLVLDVDQRYPWMRSGTKDVDGRQARREDRLGDSRVLQPDNDPVAAPVFQPSRYGVGKASRFVIDRPRSELPGVLGDSTKHLATRAERRLDDQADVRSANVRSVGLFVVNHGAYRSIDAAKTDRVWPEISLTLAFGG